MAKTKDEALLGRRVWLEEPCDMAGVAESDRLVDDLLVGRVLDPVMAWLASWERTVTSEPYRLPVVADLVAEAGAS
jgi:hypothetical protein